ncbi:MAG: hypoxanthine phosphoribosyltransferase [Magnetococcales bacterium]|nr:hypoxanthine phosphoribosyltransferase [Magnetococcales bacterium]NGZ05347.1 hypoxanthine phosphoribosyltransferase [Magnetococcales bacterium]
MPPIVEPLLTTTMIQERMRILSEEITPRLQPDVLMVTLMNGAFFFGADLARMLSSQGCRLTLDFLVMSSYGAGTVSSGTITTRLDVRTPLNNRQVLLIDDILDTGLTLQTASRHLVAKGAAEVLTCVLLDKPARRKVGIQADFVGFEIPNLFVVGYGIDYNEQYRELPFVGHIRTP